MRRIDANVISSEIVRGLNISGRVLIIYCDPFYDISLVDKKIVDEQSFNSVEQIELGKLVKGSGASFYEVPAHINVQHIQSITIWCKRFGQFMGSTNV